MDKVISTGQMANNIPVSYIFLNILFIILGSYVEDKKEGYGIFKWSDGKQYKGHWKDGK